MVSESFSSSSLDQNYLDQQKFLQQEGTDLTIEGRKKLLDANADLTKETETVLGQTKLEMADLKTWVGLQIKESYIDNFSYHKLFSDTVGMPLGTVEGKSIKLDWTGKGMGEEKKYAIKFLEGTEIKELEFKGKTSVTVPSFYPGKIEDGQIDSLEVTHGVVTVNLGGTTLRIGKYFVGGTKATQFAQDKSCSPILKILSPYESVDADGNLIVSDTPFVPLPEKKYPHPDILTIDEDPELQEEFWDEEMAEDVVEPLLSEDQFLAPKPGFQLATDPEAFDLGIQETPMVENPSYKRSKSVFDDVRPSQQKYIDTPKDISGLKLPAPVYEATKDLVFESISSQVAKITLPNTKLDLASQADALALFAGYYLSDVAGYPELNMAALSDVLTQTSFVKVRLSRRQGRKSLKLSEVRFKNPVAIEDIKAAGITDLVLRNKSGHDIENFPKDGYVYHNKFYPNKASLPRRVQERVD